MVAVHAPMQLVPTRPRLAQALLSVMQTARSAE
jgi:hypothetical protein